MQHLIYNLAEAFNSSVILGLGASFVAGILFSFSPCVYPLIPITLGIVGATQVSSRLKGFYTSLVFVLGICLTYTVLGIIASFFGLLLMKFFINPVTYFALAVIFFLLGLIMADVVKLKLPFFSFDYPKRKGLFSVFLLGLVSGLAVIPCNFPVLGAILSLISMKKNVFYGGGALFIFSLGYGTILIILGTFTSLIKKLPKAGNWLIIIKRILGLVLILVGVYFTLKFINLIR